MAPKFNLSAVTARRKDEAVTFRGMSLEEFEIEQTLADAESENKQTGLTISNENTAAIVAPLVAGLVLLLARIYNMFFGKGKRVEEATERYEFKFEKTDWESEFRQKYRNFYDGGGSKHRTSGEYAKLLMQNAGFKEFAQKNNATMVIIKEQDLHDGLRMVSFAIADLNKLVIREMDGVDHLNVSRASDTLFKRINGVVASMEQHSSKLHSMVGNPQPKTQDIFELITAINSGLGILRGSTVDPSESGIKAFADKVSLFKDALIRKLRVRGKVDYTGEIEADQKATIAYLEKKEKTIAGGGGVYPEVDTFKKEAIRLLKATSSLEGNILAYFVLDLEQRSKLADIAESVLKNS